MLSGIETALIGAALLIGLTGAWSPCGLSMVESIGPTGHDGGRLVIAAALAAFVPGALVGGVITFGSLSVAGEGLGGGGRAAYLIAVAVALLAALAEARGLRIVPQIRRQVPEHWRRVMPLPLAAGLYGILLGLGFTTFVLSFGVWALAGICLVLGDPPAGIAVGLAFGAGRALPVLLLAPLSDRAAGRRVTEMMTESPGIYRAFRLGDAAALAVVALVGVSALPAGAAVRAAAGAGDPSAAGRDLAYQRVGGGGVLVRKGRRTPLPGSNPALGGPFIAVRRGGSVVLLGRGRLLERATFRAPGVDALAVSGAWLAYRSRRGGRDVIRVRRILQTGVGAGHALGAGGRGLSARKAEPASGTRTVLGPARVIARGSPLRQLSRPSLFRSTLLYARSAPRRGAIIQRRLGTSRHRTLLSSRRWLLSDPSVSGRSFAYVRTTNERQQLRVRRRSGSGKGRLVLSLPATSRRDRDHDPGHHRLHTRVRKLDRRRINSTLLATAIAPGRVYATLLRQRPGGTRARIIRTGR